MGPPRARRRAGGDIPAHCARTDRGGVMDHETLLVRRGPRTGIPTIVAVHCTKLGPALGGCRMWHHATLDAAIEDALRLSAAMTLKASAAGLDLGGGKAVIWVPEGAAPEGERRA